MTTHETPPWPDLFILRQFFERIVCEKIAAEMKAGEGAAAIVYGRGMSGMVDQNVRKTFRATPSSGTVESVKQRLWSAKEALEKHFDVSLSECEEPQFLRYREGDFFVAHPDGNTGLLRLDTEQRRVSVSIFSQSRV